jgi:hypothetical protein
MTTNYLEKFILKSVRKYVPEGIHPELHINCQAQMYEIIMTLIKENKTPAKLSVVTYLCQNYKEILYSKYSQLN